MKPFNLTEALAGKPVVNGSGDSVLITKLAVPADCNGKLFLISQSKSGTIFAYHHENGSSDSGSNSYKLFMASTKKTVWINLYDSPICHYSKHETELDAALSTGTTYSGHAYKKLNASPIKIETEE